ncbi:D-amino-acid transaminase, chloroplastic-like [Quillaja saponaria]|uniref:D-amino-acid transaminase, chloroplastic-like n=1 Tax=Quillaja saponaria TaxID=32244 RepID=A0AAD7QI04_QUISA|nr:D-amino-acid transaminase, chloroplastic-like [Quillaja saponaria]
MQAGDIGAFTSIWIDEEGYIAEGPNVNVITHDKELVMPLFDKILTGCTAKRLLELAPKLVKQGCLKGSALKSVCGRSQRGCRNDVCRKHTSYIAYHQVG